MSTIQVEEGQLPAAARVLDFSKNRQPLFGASRISADAVLEREGDAFECYG